MNTRTAPAGSPARARPRPSRLNTAIPASSATASIQLARSSCLTLSTYRYWAARLMTNSPAARTNSSPTAVPIITDPRRPRRW